MKVKVKLFASAKERAGAAEIELELSDDATVAELFQKIGRSHPEIADIVASSRIAVNREFAPPTQPIAESDEIAVIPPVSGG